MIMGACSGEQASRLVPDESLVSRFSTSQIFDLLCCLQSALGERNNKQKLLIAAEIQHLKT